MKFTSLSIKGLVLIEPTVYTDSRGIFFESYNQQQFQKHGIDMVFVQDNQSISKKNVIRGLHFQEEPFAQGKLVTVVKGKVLDVAVDMRMDSPTFGKHISVELSETNKNIFWIPAGFAHGFSVLEDDTVFCYKCTKFYNKASERGIRFDDATLNINWGVPNPLVSEKDLQLMSLEEYKGVFK
jgi:dTDP-4-dehydrorhamnose 3,5-epimerase